MNEALSDELDAAFADSFMKPEIWLDTYYSVETDNGNGEAWKRCAEDIKKRCDAFYGRHG